MTIHYQITPTDPAAHLFTVTLTVTSPNRAGQRVMLPTWIPGSYMIREFARNIVQLSAQANGHAVNVEKIDKCTWQCAPLGADSDGPLTLTYTVYAWDLSVRAAHLDQSHGFFNGTSVFLLPEGHQESACEVAICPPAHANDWQVATSLPRAPLAVSAKNAVNTARNGDFGTFVASSYDELIDHPVEMGRFTVASFEAHGVPHHIVLTGRHRADTARLCADFKKFCEAQIALFEPATLRAPFDAYWFLITVVGDGFGGLEHRASTALICSRDELPLAHETKVTPAYRRLLSLASHEYFHSWNVKRIKPAAFVPYDLRNENYTRQLWFFEGITDYYDDLMLARCGLLSPLEYLEVEAENIGRVSAQAGRTKQSVADSSFDAWVKYYRQDENAPNAIVSYYQKGSIIGLALDLTIREKSGGAKSLDDVMRVLWNDYGKLGIGVPEGGVQRVAERLIGHSLADFFARYVDGCEDPPLKQHFDFVSVDLSWRTPNGKDAAAVASFGARVVADAHGDARLASVFDDGAARAAGLSAGDVVIAIDELRVTATNFDAKLKRHLPGETVSVVYFRRDELNRTTLTLQAQGKTTCVLSLKDMPLEAVARREKWLAG